MQSLPETIQYCWGMFSSLATYKWFKTVCGGFVGLVSYLFGETRELALMLCVLVVMDFILALIATHKVGGVIQSSKALRSALKLMVYGLIISAGHLTEAAVQVIPFIDDTVIAFLAVTELISILEHAGTIGFAIPQKLLNKLEAFRDEK